MLNFLSCPLPSCSPSSAAPVLVAAKHLTPNNENYFFFQRSKISFHGWAHSSFDLFCYIASDRKEFNPARKWSGKRIRCSTTATRSTTITTTTPATTLTDCCSGRGLIMIGAVGRALSSNTKDPQFQSHPLYFKYKRQTGRKKYIICKFPSRVTALFGNKAFWLVKPCHVTWSTSHCALFQSTVIT